MATLVLPFFILIVLVFINGVFSCAEIASINMSDTKLQKRVNEGDKHAIRLHKLLSKPSEFLSTIQIGITISGFFGSAYAAQAFTKYLSAGLAKLPLPIEQGSIDAIALVIITIILSYFTLVFGELVPKRIGLQNSERIALALVNVIYTLAIITKPFVQFLTFSTHIVLKAFGINDGDISEEVTEEEIRMLVDVGLERGNIDVDEKEMIDNVFTFDDRQAEEIMIHRSEIEPIFLTQKLDEVLDLLLNADGIPLPVCDGTIDNIQGFLRLDHLVRYVTKKENEVSQSTLKTFLERNDVLLPSSFMSEHATLPDILLKMRENQSKIVTVIDEYGGVEGFVIYDDIVEEIIGDFETGNPEIIQRSKHIYITEGTTPIFEIEDYFDVELASDDVTTIGGYVLSKLGNNLENVEKGNTVETKQLILKVRTVKDTRIGEIVIIVKHKGEETSVS